MGATRSGFIALAYISKPKINLRCLAVYLFVPSLARNAPIPRLSMRPSRLHDLGDPNVNHIVRETVLF